MCGQKIAPLIIMSADPLFGRCVIKSPSSSISAAALQTTRLAALSRTSFAYCTGKSVFRLNCTPQRKRLRHTEENAGQPASTVESDYLLPNASYKVDVLPDLQHSVHRAEIMSLCYSEGRFASVDENGACIVSVGSSEEESSSFCLQPPSLTFGEPGWAGVALQKGEFASSATARQYYRDVSLYDKDILVSALHTVAEPAALSFIGKSCILAVAEGNAIALYDSRAPGRASCVARKVPSPKVLLALDVSDNGQFIAVSGNDRTVHVLDTKSMTFRERWTSCLKYECAGLKMSLLSPGMVWLAGKDNEFAYGAWDSKMTPDGSKSLMISGANTKSPRRTYGFRGDARITGIDCVLDDHGEVVGAISEAGSFYIIERKK